MNKKFATLMFAIGLGAAAAPAFAFSCAFYCNKELIACLKSGELAEVCYADNEACNASC